MPTTRMMAVAMLGGLALAGCAVRNKDNATTTTTTTETETAGVTREAVPSPTPSPTPLQQAAIQSQPGPQGNTVALNKVAVTGDILTVSMTFSGGTCCVHIPVGEVSVIDDATSQRISVLKDNASQPMAAPLESQGKSISPDAYDKPSVVWFKFPAPPATSKTVSITVPGVAPFDAVPVTR